MQATSSWAGISNRPSPAGGDYWEVRLDKKHLPFLDDHRIEGDRGIAGISLSSKWHRPPRTTSSGPDLFYKRHRISPAAYSCLRARPHDSGQSLRRQSDGQASFQIYSRSLRNRATP